MSKELRSAQRNEKKKKKHATLKNDMNTDAGTPYILHDNMIQNMTKNISRWNCKAKLRKYIAEE